MCPTRAHFEAFSTGPQLAEALRSAGLPTPTITPLGEIHATVVKQPVSA